MNKQKTKFLLDQISSPEDIRGLSLKELNLLCSELREFIIDTVSTKGGHFGASLGVVELSVAIHYIFNTPFDNLIWDVGHQAYVHKIITGRKNSFHTNRKLNGISGFPKIEESEYDAFGVGHSSTSISALLGMALANKLIGSKKQHIAVIGDGALTGGMAFEAINHAGYEKANILIILNDNGMSIDPNVGALNAYLSAGKTNTNAVDFTKSEGNTKTDFISTPPNGLTKNNEFFDSLNFNYYGIIDGHDLEVLVSTLKSLKDVEGPKLLHIKTIKGKGYQPAEEGNPTTWHAPGLFDKNTGEIKKKKSNLETPIKYQDVFGYSLLEIAKQNKKVVGITPAMPTGSSLNIMMEALPERTFDVGIAEQHAVTFSSGLAKEGLKPFCNIYSTFMQRAYDQVIHDVALQKLPVAFCLDRGGLVGADGPTHHGVFDIAYFRSIPNIVISSPLNESELRNLMYTASQFNEGPIVIRYPRGKGVLKKWDTPFKTIQIGTAQQISTGKHAAVLSFGPIGNKVIEASNELLKESITIDHYDMRFAKPIDEGVLHKVFKKHKNIITLEDGTVIGGLGSAVIEFMNANNYSSKITKLGVPDNFIEQGSQEELYNICEYNTQHIIEAIKKNVNEQ